MFRTQQRTIIFFLLFFLSCRSCYNIYSISYQLLQSSRPSLQPPQPTISCFTPAQWQPLHVQVRTLLLDITTTSACFGSNLKIGIWCLAPTTWGNFRILRVLAAAERTELFIWSTSLQKYYRPLIYLRLVKSSKKYGAILSANYTHNWHSAR